MVVRIFYLILTIIFALCRVEPTFALDPPVPISPALGTTVTTSKIEWQTPSYQLYSSNPYRVQVDDDSSFGSLNKDYYTANTTYTPSLSNGTWYWKVKAKDFSEIWSDWSSIWSFTLNTTSTPSPSPSSSPSPQSSSSNLTISNLPSQIDSTETFNVFVNLSLPNNSNTNFYLKGAFKIKEGINYFGLTKVGDSWIKNSIKYEEQYKITTDGNGNWLGNLEIMPDILDSGYEGAGEYIFKVGRYAESGSLNWSNEVTIKINAQEVILEEKEDKNESEILGITETQTETNKASSEKNEEFSLDKYVKTASVATVAATATPSAIEVKNQKQLNPVIVLGGILVFAGTSSLGYIYWKKKHEKLY